MKMLITVASVLNLLKHGERRTLFKVIISNFYGPLEEFLLIE